MKRFSLLLMFMLFFTALFCVQKTHASTIISRTLVLSPTDYGARANDNIDDSDAFQKCLNEAKKNNGAKIIVPQGRFIIAKELRLEGTSNL